MISYDEYLDLLTDQMILDHKIEETKNVDLREQHKKSKIFVAANTELGEFSQEVKPLWCYWKKPNPVMYTKAIEELIDVLHFNLSGQLVQVHGVATKNEFERVGLTAKGLLAHKELSQLIEILTFNLLETSGTYVIFAIGNMLGYSDEDMIKVYKSKHAVNMHRQETGY